MWDAVRLLGVVQNGGSLLSDATAQGASEHFATEAAETSAPADIADASGSDDEVDAADDDGHGRRGTCSVYTTPTGNLCRCRRRSTMRIDVTTLTI